MRAIYCGKKSPQIRRHSGKYYHSPHIVFNPPLHFEDIQRQSGVNHIYEG